MAKIMQLNRPDDEIREVVCTTMEEWWRLNSYEDDCVTYGNGKFVSVGNSYCFYSTNGMNWNEVNLIGTYQSIIYGNGKFVAVGDNGKVAYSSDGINWFSIILMNGWKNWDFYAVTYIGDQFVAIGSEGNIAYSSDGISWDTIKGGVNTTYHGIFAVQ